MLLNSVVCKWKDAKFRPMFGRPAMTRDLDLHGFTRGTAPFVASCAKQGVLTIASSILTQTLPETIWLWYCTIIIVRGRLMFVDFFEGHPYPRIYIETKIKQGNESSYVIWLQTRYPRNNVITFNCKQSNPWSLNPSSRIFFNTFATFVAQYFLLIWYCIK